MVEAMAEGITAEVIMVGHHGGHHHGGPHHHHVGGFYPGYAFGGYGLGFGRLWPGLLWRLRRLCGYGATVVMVLFRGPYYSPPVVAVPTAPPCIFNNSNLSLNRQRRSQINYWHYCRNRKAIILMLKSALGLVEVAPQPSSQN